MGIASCLPDSLKTKRPYSSYLLCMGNDQLFAGFSQDIKPYSSYLLCMGNDQLFAGFSQDKKTLFFLPTMYGE